MEAVPAVLIFTGAVLVLAASFGLALLLGPFAGFNDREPKQ